MIIVVADDLSGAAEIAGVALSQGLTAEVHIDELGLFHSDVVVIDTNTRSCSAAQSASILQRIGKEIAKRMPELIYKKVDSLLRGPIAAEAIAMQTTLDLERTLIINSNPRKKRLVYAGCLWVDQQPIDQTMFASDPEYPRRTALIDRLLSPCPSRIELVSPKGNWPDHGLLVGEVTEANHLCEFAQRILRTPTLAAGGAEFFEAVLQTYRKKQLDHVLHSPLCLVPGTLIVSGTSLLSPFNSLPNAITLQRHDCGEQLQSMVNRQFQQTGFAVLAVGAPRKNSADSSSMHDELKSGALHSILKHCKPQQVWIEGGRTASEVIRKMSWHRLIAEFHYSDGVVGLRPCHGAAPRVVVKPGSYAWPIDYVPSSVIEGIAL